VPYKLRSEGRREREKETGGGGGDIHSGRWSCPVRNQSGGECSSGGVRSGSVLGFPFFFFVRCIWICSGVEWNVGFAYRLPGRGRRMRVYIIELVSAFSIDTISENCLPAGEGWMGGGMR